MVGFTCMVLGILIYKVNMLRIGMKFIESLFCKVIISLCFIQGQLSGKHGYEKYLLCSDAINTKYHASLNTLAVAHDVVEGE